MLEARVTSLENYEGQLLHTEVLDSERIHSPIALSTTWQSASTEGGKKSARKVLLGNNQSSHPAGK